MKAITGSLTNFDRSYSLRLASLREVDTHITFESVFVDEYQKMVALAAAVSGSRVHAEDIAQEAMGKLNRNWDKVSAYDKPGAWLRRVTINLALSSKRKFLAEGKAILGLGNECSISKTHPEQDEHLWSFVSSLPKKQRSIIALYYLDGYKVEEIAEILDIKPSTARVHMHNARESLRTKLSNNLEKNND